MAVRMHLTAVSRGGWWRDFFFLSLFVYFPVCSIKLGEDTPLYAEEDEMKRGRVKSDTGGGV